MKTREQILDDPTLTAYQRGKLMAEISQAEASAPPVTPSPTAEQVNQLRQLRAEILRRGNDLATFDKSEQNYAELLPKARETLAALESTTGPDASRDALLIIAAEQVRVQRLVNFLGCAGERRRGIEGLVLNSLQTLDWLCAKVCPQLTSRSFMAGHFLHVRIRFAVEKIDALLK